MTFSLNGETAPKKTVQPQREKVDLPLLPSSSLARDTYVTVQCDSSDVKRTWLNQENNRVMCELNCGKVIALGLLAVVLL